MGNAASLCQEAAAPKAGAEVAAGKLAVDAAAQAAVVDAISGDEMPVLPAPGALGESPAGGEGEGGAAAGDEEEAQAEAEAAAEEEGGKAIITLSTAPIDPRFNTANASRYCYVAYNEAHRCYQERGQDSPECARYARAYRSLCPSEWITAWNEARENGTWWGKY